jgi:hypothetical protein
VVDDLDVVTIRIEHERPVVARVVDGALAGHAVVPVARGERGSVEGPHGGVRVRGERQMDVLGERAIVANDREAGVLVAELHAIRGVVCQAQAACGAIVG